ncbi:DUF590 family protein [Cavenderia fasciculata]|uniref:DUF590 family protein n=1 Tax=Cavenderia fasciculata TaxID=261658 RepID=F4Q5A9_CACFS|nr:DUF590 family protein [Cavenderia fasciculata]EGG17168.1 DUF590 family protein [Cavenderia fasciculata]|eukprot:XP_004355652.1 DUF590 family protein [Cavenderia fasciculata]
MDENGIPLDQRNSYYQPNEADPNAATLQQQQQQQFQQLPDNNRYSFHQRSPSLLPDEGFYLYTTAPEYIAYSELNMKEKILENMFGYTVRGKKAAIPDGYMVDYTRFGQPYLLAHTDKTGGGDSNGEPVDPTDILAAEEHQKHNLTMRCTTQQIEEKFGIGIYLYFDFIKFCLLINSILLCGVLINVVPHLYYENDVSLFKDFTSTDMVFVAINLASYIHDDYKQLYYWSTVGTIILSFLMGPIYALKVHHYFKKQKLEDFEDGFTGDDVIRGNERVSSRSRAFRFAVSYSVFIILIGISAICTVYVLKTVNNYQFLANILTTSLVSAIILRVINVIYEFMCLYLTKLEGHRTWTNFRNHNTLKLFVFKVINVLVLYILRDKIFRDITDQVVQAGCPLIDVGSQFFFILLMDLTLQNIWEIVYSVGMARIGRCIGKRGKKSTDSYKPEFDLAEEYLELLYRQFIVYLGIPIYPLVAVFGVLCNLAEFYVDKFRLLKICRRPHRVQGSMKRFLSFYLLIIAVVSVVSYPYGSGWVLVQFGFDRGDLNANCPQLFSNNATLLLGTNQFGGW